MEYLGSARMKEHASPIRPMLTLEEGCALLVRELLPAAFLAAIAAKAAAANEKPLSDDDVDDDDDGDAWSDRGDIAHPDAGGGGGGRGSGDMPDGAAGGPIMGGVGPRAGGSVRVALGPLSGHTGKTRSLLGPLAQKRLESLITAAGINPIDLRDDVEKFLA